MGKGSRSECSSYRPITLLSVPGKVFAHVLLARLDLYFRSIVDLTNPDSPVVAPHWMSSWHCVC